MGYTAGVFDLFHRGHQQYLEACSTKCDCLVVGVDSDQLVRQKKGSERPIQTCATRLETVRESGYSTITFLKEHSADHILPLLRPDIYFIPSTRELTSVRLVLLRSLGTKLIKVEYSKGVSTTALARLKRKP